MFKTLASPSENLLIINASSTSSSTSLMAVRACRCASSSCSSSQNLCVFRFSFGVGEPPRQLRCGAQRFLHCEEIFSNTCRIGTRITAKKPVKSNEELCNDLLEFVSMAGFPEGHVPSLKELAEHGRKDLANIVRRRGYRLIADFMRSSITTKGDIMTEMSLSKNHEANDVYKDESVEGQYQEENKLVEGLSSSIEVSNMEDYSSSTNGVMHLNSIAQHESLDCSIDSSLHEKAAKFIQDGELEIADGESHDSNTGYDVLSTNSTHFEDSVHDIEAEAGLSKEKYSISEVKADNSTSIENARALTPKIHAPLGMGQNANREDFSSAEEIEVNDRDHQVEIKQLKAMLHQKELELSQLKQQIKKEKLALSALQAKAEQEISKAQEILSAKDEELLAVEESLSGLKEVHIEYLGDGETVELAGSFNGWHDRIKMDFHSPSSSLNSSDSRKSRLWSAVLWLYPGIYEIKFIVDGHWRIDPRRESVVRGTIQNNILKVDR